MNDDVVDQRIRAALVKATLPRGILERRVPQIRELVTAIVDCLRGGGKLLIFGNGGSAADAQHMAAEFSGRFQRDRKALAAIALTTDPSVMTAIANDFGFEQVFARQIEALGRPGDLAIAISASGRSANVLAGVRAARAEGLRTFALTGAATPLAELCDGALAVPAASTARIQEQHIIAIHVVCEAVDEILFGAVDPDAELPTGKRMPFEQLLEARGTWRAQGLRVVWTNGAFDLLHSGHVKTLGAAKSLGDLLVVGVNSDASVRRAKGADRPVLPLEERITLVGALEAVDVVTELDADTPERMLAALQPDVHCKGQEYQPPGGKPMPELRVVEGYGGTVVFLPLVPAISTTDVIRRVRASARDDQARS